MTDEEILEAAENIKKKHKKCRLERKLDKLEKTIQVGFGVIIALLILFMCILWFDADTREHRAKIRDAKSKNFLLDIQKMKRQKKSVRPRNKPLSPEKEIPVRVYGKGRDWN